MKKKVVAFVPIKYNSQRLPNKNFLPLGDKALCSHVFDSLLEVEEIDEVYVFCSNSDISKHLPKQVRFLERDKILDRDETLGMEIYEAFCEKIPADVYVLCHATSPFISCQSIAEGVRAVIDENYDSAFSVEKHQTFTWYKGNPLNYKLSHIPRTQDLEAIYLENSAFFIFENKILKQYKRRIGERPYMVVTSRFESIDIDYQEDYELAKAVYELLKKTKK